EEARLCLTSTFQASSVYELNFVAATSLGTLWLKLEDRRELAGPVEVLVYSDQGTVTSIQFNFYSALIFSPGGDHSYVEMTLARLQGLFGAPTRMIVPDVNAWLNRLDYLTLLYGSDDSGILINTADLNVNAPIFSMIFYGNSSPIKAIAARTNQIRRWRGFVSSERYSGLIASVIP